MTYKFLLALNGLIILDALIFLGGGVMLGTGLGRLFSEPPPKPMSVTILLIVVGVALITGGIIARGRMSSRNRFKLESGKYYTTTVNWNGSPLSSDSRATLSQLPGVVKIDEYSDRRHQTLKILVSVETMEGSGEAIDNFLNNCPELPKAS